MVLKYFSIFQQSLSQGEKAFKPNANPPRFVFGFDFQYCSLLASIFGL